MKMKLAGVIGLGLIGGSIAKALKYRLNMDIIGVDINTQYINEALSSGVIIEGGNDISTLKNCDIIFICTPVNMALEYLDKLAAIAKNGCIITDVGSTKEEIMEYAKHNLPSKILFIGGHPMTGSEKSGFSESKSHLFENVYYILSPRKKTDRQAVDWLTKIVKGFGALPIVLDANTHDMAVAAISHLPHVIASGLVNMVNKLDGSDNHMHRLAAGGFKDITRIASSSPVMWQNICFSNSRNICTLVDMYIDLLEKFKKDIMNNSSQKVYTFFDEAKNYRDSFPIINRGPIEPLFNLFIDVEDKPGVIGEIAVLLGANKVNIKNIGISNSREMQIGALVISFNTQQDLNNAEAILNGDGYITGK